MILEYKLPNLSVSRPTNSNSSPGWEHDRGVEGVGEGPDLAETLVHDAFARLDISCCHFLGDLVQPDGILEGALHYALFNLHEGAVLCRARPIVHSRPVSSVLLLLSFGWRDTLSSSDVPRAGLAGSKLVDLAVLLRRDNSVHQGQFVEVSSHACETCDEALMAVQKAGCQNKTPIIISQVKA